MADTDGSLTQTDRDGHLPLPCSFMDIHICGACKTQFNNVELFIAHKQQSCPVFVEIRSISFDHLAATSTSIAQTTSPNVTMPGSLLMTTGTTNSNASSIVTPSLAENTNTTFSNHHVVHTNGPHVGNEVESNGHFTHLHSLTNTIDHQNDHADQSLSAKLELPFLDVQQVVREEFKNKNNTKHPFLVSSATNCHQLIGESQKILQTDEDHSTVTQISHKQKENHIAEEISQPSQIMTPKQLMRTLQLNSSANNTSSSDQALMKSAQHQATDMTATMAVTQHFFADQIITEPVDNPAAIASNDLQTGQQSQLTTNFPLQHQEPQQSLVNEANVDIVSSVSSPSLSFSLMNGQSSNGTEDSYELRMMTSTDDSSVQVHPTRGYMAIVEEFEVSSNSNTMLNECETQPASLMQQPLPHPPPPPPPDELQQQQPPPLPTQHPTPHSHASVHISDEASNNFDTDTRRTNLLVQQNGTNQLQPVLPLTHFITNTCVSTKQTVSATNVNKMSLKNRQAAKKKFKCTFEVCEFQTAYLKDLERHTRTHTGERPFQCQICRKSFNRSDKLKIHQRVHTGNKPYQCQICSYSSVDSSSLKKHMRIHTNERPFKCQMCSYASRNSSQLIVHLRTHTGDSPFQCQLCDAKFKINSDLKRHVRTHTGEKPFKCEFCDYRCSIKANLKSHHYRINHSTENQFQCNTCSFTSSSRKLYKEHMKTHDTDRPIKCLLCMYKCSRKSALITHLRTHSEERPVRCDFCTYTSKQDSNVQTHMKKKHAEKLRQKKKNLSHKSSEPGKKISEGMTNQSVEMATSSSVDSINGSQVRIKLNCKKAYNCQQCDASFVRQDSLLSHVRQHQNIEKALQSTAMAVLQLQNPVRPLNQQISSDGTPDGANQVATQHTPNSSKTASEQCLTSSLPAISTSVTKSVSIPTSLFSSISPISSRLNPKTSKNDLAFQQSQLNISDGQSSNQENHSLLNGLSSSQKSLLSSFSQPVNISSIRSNNSCSQQPQLTESIQSCLNISRNNSNVVSMATNADDPKEMISQNSTKNNTSNNLIQQKQITDSVSQSLHRNMIISPLSTIATTSQTNVSQVLPSSVTSPGVSTNGQSIVNSYLLNNQPQQGTIVSPQFLQNLTALQLISNVSLPFFRMPTAQMGTQTAQILPNQFLSQPHEPINVVSSPLASTLNATQQQQTPSEIPVQIISQRNQQQNTIPINVQISQLNFDATSAAIRNEILDQRSTGAMIASFQVIVPQHMQPATAANTVPQVCTLASASSLNSASPASIPASSRGEILVQVSSCSHTSHNSMHLPSDQSSHLSTNASTITPITSSPTNLISVIGQTLTPTTADNANPH